MVNDPIADTLIQIKNGYLASKEKISVPYSKIKYELIKLLVEKGFVKSQKVVGDGYKKQIVIELKYENKKGALSNVLRVSKPSLRIYVNKNSIPKVFGGLGITIISTSKGLMTGEEARKKKVGGELICKIW